MTIEWFETCYCIECGISTEMNNAYDCVQNLHLRLLRDRPYSLLIKYFERLFNHNVRVIVTDTDPAPARTSFGFIIPQNWITA